MPGEEYFWRTTPDTSQVANDAEPLANRPKTGTTVEALNGSQADAVEQNRLFHAVLSNISQGVCMFDEGKNLLVCNDRYAEMYGLKPEFTRPGTPLRTILEQRVSVGSSPAGVEDYVGTRLGKTLEDSWYGVDELRNGRTVSISHRKIPGGGIVSTHEDITDRRKAEARIEHLAHHDPLTGLPNRTNFRKQMEFELNRLPRENSIALICIDLDHFKNVNDTLGHPAGDTFLRQVGKRLKGCVREKDSIARLGGDEFAVIQPNSDLRRAKALAWRIVRELSGHYDVAGVSIVTGASAGVAMAPNDGTNCDQLMRNADMALYRAKAEGRNTFRFFELEMDTAARERHAMEMDLRHALEAGEFEIHYQPLIDSASGDAAGVEALLRWPHPKRGNVGPDQFIPIAEEIGLITQIGEWVLNEACREVASWPGNLKLAVNLSPEQFRHGDLVKSVAAALAGSGLTPDRLELEITESLLLQDNQRTLEALHRLKDLGVSISMDDFGTGYCSLSYLRSFPFDKIKIDRSFVQELGEDGDCRAIIEAIVTLGRRLGITTTAEGVETDDQLRELESVGCSQMQGYLFSKARPGAELCEFLTSLEKKKKQAETA